MWLWNELVRFKWTAIKWHQYYSTIYCVTLKLLTSLLWNVLLLYCYDFKEFLFGNNHKLVNMVKRCWYMNMRILIEFTFTFTLPCEIFSLAWWILVLYEWLECSRCNQTITEVNHKEYLPKNGYELLMRPQIGQSPATLMLT